MKRHAIQTRFARRRTQLGQSIAVALIALGFLTLIGGMVTVTLLAEGRLARRQEAQLAALYIAKAGAEFAELKLVNDDAAYDCLSDPWTAKPKDLFDVTINGGHTDIADNSPCAIVDEERKLNINTADSAMLCRLDPANALTPEIAAAIVAYREKQPFRSVNELLRVPGVDSALLRVPREGVPEGLGSLLTVYGNGKININTAPKPVLVALGLTQDEIDKIMQSQEEMKPFAKDVQEVQRRLSDDSFAKLKDLIAVSSKYFTVTSVGCIEGYFASARSEIREVVHRDASGAISRIQFEPVRSGQRE